MSEENKANNSQESVEESKNTISQVNKADKLAIQQGPRMVNTILMTLIISLVTAGTVFLLANNHYKRLISELTLNEEGMMITQEVVKQVVVTQEDAQIGAIDTVAQAIVGVVNFSDNRQVGEGSGIVYKVENGNTYIVTNEHVISGGDYFEVVFDNEGNDRIEVELVGSDIFTDLAVLRILDFEAETIARFGNTEDLQIGQTVIAIGNPLGLNFAGSATSGIVSGHDRTINVTLGNTAEDWEMTVLQTDTAINPGNSGGALINLAGEVVGINSMKIANESIEGMSFSIPTYIALPIIADLETYNEVRRPTLGVSIINMSSIPDRFKEMANIPVEQRTGSYVDEVSVGSLAEEMGIIPGDVIIALNGTEITNNLSFRKTLFNYRAGDEITITVLRRGSRVDLTTVVEIASQE